MLCVEATSVRPSVCFLLSATKRLSEFHEIRRWGALQKNCPISFSFVVNLFNSRSSSLETTSCSAFQNVSLFVKL